MNIRTSSFEEEIERNGCLIYTNVGNSMLPIIREGRDVLVIATKPKDRLKKYDVPLYRRPNGQYVLHRVIQVRERDYVLCGDNRRHREHGIQDSWIVGVLTEIHRGKRVIRTSDPLYRAYVHLWCGLFWFRAVLLWMSDRLHTKMIS